MNLVADFSQEVGSFATIFVLVPEELHEEAEEMQQQLGARAVAFQVYDTAASLIALVHQKKAWVILLSSYDTRFGNLRHSERTIRWTHEMPGYFDPQASRCNTPIFAASEDAARQLAGYAGVARPYQSFEYLNDLRCEYCPGPICILGVGDIMNPRKNFKSFQRLAEKYPMIKFVWRGANLNKSWKNLEFCTADTSFQSLLAISDYLCWCPDDDLLPLMIFEALYVGVRVMLFEKHYSYGVPSLFSIVDGCPLLALYPGMPQHAPLHKITKNTKNFNDIEISRAYVRGLVGEAPPALLKVLRSRLVEEASPSQPTTTISDIKNREASEAVQEA